MKTRRACMTVSEAILFASAAGSAAAQGITSFTANGRPLAQGGGSGSSAGGGDLWIHLECTGQAHADYIEDTAYLYLQIFVDGDEVANGWFEGNPANGYIDAWIRASSFDRTGECDSSGPYADGTDWGDIPGAGPGSVDIVIRSFIMQEWIGNPADMGISIFEGDNRSFQAYGGTARITTVYDVLNPAVNDGDILSGPYFGAGMTVKYDRDTSLAPPPFGPISQQAKDDWTPGYPMKLDWAIAPTDGMWCSAPARQGPSPYDFTSTHTFTCVASAANPLVDGSPSIDSRFYFTFKYGNGYRAEYWLDGCHDAFPSTEVYANGIPLLEDTQSSDFLDLYANCGTTIYTRHGYIH